MTLSQKTKQDDYQIQTMTRDDLALVVEWAAAEGWNPGLYDVECFYTADPNGFLIGRLAGEPIASISVVKYGTDFGFLGFYIVRPEFRGRGYGLRIWQAGLDYLKGRNVGLDGVVEQQSNYVESGFTLAHRNVRYEGVGDVENNNFEGKESISGGIRLVDLASIPVEKVIEYDRSIFLGQRSAFISCWVRSRAHKVLGAMDGDRLAGYSVLRPCQQGYKIGPLFADSAQLAESLFLALRAQVEPGSSFYLDVPSTNMAAVALAETYQMTSVFETARMYNKSAPDLPLNRIYGITTFELG